jgi:hypothetical protein
MSLGFLPACLQVLDCHDAVVYALAPLQYALISACSDCVIVLGAVGRVLRIERCERVQASPSRLPGRFDLFLSGRFDLLAG